MPDVLSDEPRTPPSNTNADASKLNGVTVPTLGVVGSVLTVAAGPTLEWAVPAYGSAVLSSSSVAIPSTAPNYLTGLTCTLTAGTWRVRAYVRIGLNCSVAGGYVTLRFYDFTNSADIVDSQRMGFYSTPTGQLWYTTVVLEEIVTVTATTVIRVYGNRGFSGGYTTCLAAHDGDGKCKLIYERMF